MVARTSGNDYDVAMKMAMLLMMATETARTRTLVWMRRVMMMPTKIRGLTLKVVQIGINITEPKCKMCM